MTLAGLAPDYIRAISPYQPGKPISELAREMGIAAHEIIKLASNENPLGMSPKARQAAAVALEDLSRYPDGNGFELKAALAQRYRVGHDAIVLGNGSNDVLEMAARAFLSRDCAAVYSQHAFAVYPLATRAAGAAGIEVPAREYGHDLEAMLSAITAHTRIVFVANPNNPTGTLARGEQLALFMERVREDVLVVLDEAYNEYLPLPLRYNSVAWLARFPNLVLTRTFSKAYGLAGLRVGFALAHPEVADLMNRVRQPFNVSSVALAAAQAALGDDAFVATSHEHNRRGLAQLVAGFERMGVSYIPSYGNFVTFHAGDAARVNARLLEQGIIVRPIANYGLPRHLRVTVGLETENQRFLEALAKALGGH
ncbi:MAG: histidinol-phosphate transaminase [Betaproteobacteria bacterium CG2_30_68_42]|nr:MAG: histidinol-phosphate transaminase [Betaproteobacteria bacterium CG2_30_68_42]PIX74166.1 MAG: histidinol-phosphate transaminase [Rhodocyclales bacterium CG_4_10_14_3_um_filter_68_10]PJA56253.1 MAG: histidinol-phosphate transaminase [Rhodocyclales bacterium CG_4_9_14_3_um_filter_68_10]